MLGNTIRENAKLVRIAGLNMNSKAITWTIEQIVADLGHTITKISDFSKLG